MSASKPNVQSVWIEGNWGVPHMFKEKLESVWAPLTHGRPEIGQIIIFEGDRYIYKSTPFGNKWVKRNG
jgi:hypothetical protein